MRNCGYIKEQFEKIHTEVKECDGSNLFPQGSEKNYTECVRCAHILTTRDKSSNRGKVVKKNKKKKKMKNQGVAHFVHHKAKKKKTRKVVNEKKI